MIDSSWDWDSLKPLQPYQQRLTLVKMLACTISLRLRHLERIQQPSRVSWKHQHLRQHLIPRTYLQPTRKSKSASWIYLCLLSHILTSLSTLFLLQNHVSNRGTHSESNRVHRRTHTLPDRVPYSLSYPKSNRGY